MRISSDRLFRVRQLQAPLRELSSLGADEHQVLVERGIEAAHEVAELIHAKQGSDELPLIARSTRRDAGEVIEAVLFDEAEAVLRFVGLHSLGLVWCSGRQDGRDMATQPGIVAVCPLVDPLDLGLADGAEHRHFQRLAEAALAGTVGAIDQSDVVAEVECLLPHESAKRSHLKLAQAPQRRPDFGSVAISWYATGICAKWATASGAMRVERPRRAAPTSARGCR